MPGQYRTISGAFHQEPNIEHNNRDHIPWNANSERADRNVIFVNGTKNFTLEQAYEKLFQLILIQKQSSKHNRRIVKWTKLRKFLKEQLN